MDIDFSVHIDLHNLEDAQFEGSKYVLTSPRSLEACSRLNVKPIELLYKPLSEFQEELLPQDIPLKTIYSLYDEGEVIRQKKLKLCRQERSRIIASDSGKASQALLKEELSKMPSEEVQEKRTRKIRITPTAPAGYRSRGKPKLATSSRFPDKESSKLHRELVSKKDKNPTRPKSALKTRPGSGKKRKPQRMTSSVTFGSKINVRTNSIPNMTIKLPARDEKILHLMQQRRDEERRAKEVTKQTALLWDDERKREDALRIIAENKRRQILAEENRIQDEKRAREIERRHDLEVEALELKKLSIEESEYKSDMRLMDQLKMQELQLSEKVSKNLAKKANQEQNLKTSEKEAEMGKHLTLVKRDSALTSAGERKDMRLHHETLKKFYDNRRERELYERRQVSVKEQERENSHILKSSIEGRLGKAESNLSQILESRNQILEKKRREEELKLRRARSAHRKMEAEMDAWRQGLLFHKKMLEEKAADVVDRSIELKAWRVKKDRTRRQLEQKKNIAKRVLVEIKRDFYTQKKEGIHKEVEKWRTDLESTLLEKDKKLEDLFEEKERSVAQTRAMAQLSQTLRDDIKERYLSDTFDKKVLEAQMYSSLNNSFKPKTPSLKNRSSIKVC